MTVTGLYYPLQATQSGDIQLASTLDETLVGSWAQFIIDTEQPFPVFASTADDISLGVEKFRYSLTNKCPAANFKVTASKQGNQLIVDVEWSEGTVSLTVQQVV